MVRGFPQGRWLVEMTHARDSSLMATIIGHGTQRNGVRATTMAFVERRPQAEHFLEY
jgi:hypothetical protein